VVFQLASAVELLRRTPAVLDAWLGGLPDEWLSADEGPGTFSPLEVVGHLIHGERTDWMPRLRIVLAHGEARAFEPFDRFAQRAGPPRAIGALLDELARLRAANLAELAALDLGPAELARTGRHPELGVVTARELLATWVVHDQSHLRQIARVLAKRLAPDVGPWRAYLPVMDE
jgi:hypothetical protein